MCTPDAPARSRSQPSTPPEALCSTCDDTHGYRSATTHLYSFRPAVSWPETSYGSGCTPPLAAAHRLVELAAGQQRRRSGASKQAEHHGNANCHRQRGCLPPADAAHRGDHWERREYSPRFQTVSFAFARGVPLGCKDPTANMRTAVFSCLLAALAVTTALDPREINLRLA